MSIKTTIMFIFVVFAATATAFMIVMLDKSESDECEAEAGNLDRFTMQRAGSLSDEYITTVYLYLIRDTERGGEYLLVRRLGGSEVDIVPLIDDSVSVVIE